MITSSCFFTDAAGQTARRDFTPHRYHAGRAELLIDFVLHESGPVTRWVSTATTGMTLAVGGPRGSSIIPTELGCLPPRITGSSRWAWVSVSADRGLYPGPGTKRGEAMKWIAWTDVTFGEAVTRWLRNVTEWTR
jgi:hypothetical protein